MAVTPAPFPSLAPGQSAVPSKWGCDRTTVTTNTVPGSTATGTDSCAVTEWKVTPALSGQHVAVDSLPAITGAVGVTSAPPVSGSVAVTSLPPVTVATAPPVTVQVSQAPVVVEQCKPSCPVDVASVGPDLVSLLAWALGLLVLFGAIRAVAVIRR